MLRLFLSSTLVTVLVTVASAQTIVINPKDRTMQSPTATEPVRVAIGVNMFVPAPNGDEQSLKAQEDARRMVYQLAGRECAILNELIASECRLESVNVNVQRTQGGFNQGRTDGFTVNGNINYRVIPK